MSGVIEEKDEAASKAADELRVHPDVDPVFEQDEAADDAPRGAMAAAEAMERLGRGETLRGVRIERLAFVGEVEHPVRMVGVTLVQPIFDGAKFAAEVSFRRCTLDRPRFKRRETAFARGLDLSGSTLTHAIIRRIRVDGPLAAGNLRARGRFLVAQSRFHGHVSFWDARFEAWVDFKDCAFADHADFRAFHAEEGFVLHACSFEGDALFRGAAVCKKFDLTDSRFEGLLDLSKAKLHDFSYLEGIEQGPRQRFAFHNALAERLLVRIDQLAGRIDSEERGDHARAAEEYGLLKRAFEGLHRYEHEDWAFYRFKVNQRRCHKRTWRRPWTKLAQFFDWLLLDLGCGYGTNPLRAVRTALVIMLAFSLIYIAGAETLPVEAWPFPRDVRPQDYFPNRLLVGLLTSVSVFTSGFGTVRDAAQGWMNIPLIVESLLGTFLWGLFIVAFSRKVIR
jgi:uncharacterized protein YjbI with pentapeptide repeats